MPILLFSCPAFRKQPLRSHNSIRKFHSLVTVVGSLGQKPWLEEFCHRGRQPWSEAFVGRILPPWSEALVRSLRRKNSATVGEGFSNPFQTVSAFSGDLPELIRTRSPGIGRTSLFGERWEDTPLLAPLISAWCRFQDHQASTVLRTTVPATQWARFPTKWWLPDSGP